MVFGFFRKRENPSVYEVYNKIVEQARRPHFYAALRVPDTIDGRYDLIMLHAILVFYRLGKEKDEKASAFSQEVFDLFFQDMDRNLRELGVGDVIVPKKIKKMAEMFYGRAGVYTEAIETGDHEALTRAIDRNLFADEGDPVAASAIAAYMEATTESLKGETLQSLLSGNVAWIDETAFTA